MKRLSFLWMLVATVMLLASCSKKQAARLIPEDAVVVVRLDVTKMLKGAGADSDDSSLKKWLRKEIKNANFDKETRQRLLDVVDDPTNSGIDFTEPLYVFVGGDLQRNVDYGVVGTVASGGDLNTLIETILSDNDELMLEEGDGGTRYVAQRDMAFIYTDDWFYFGPVEMGRGREPKVDDTIETLLARADGEGSLQGNQALQKMEEQPGLAQLLLLGSGLDGKRGMDELAEMLPDGAELKDVAMLSDFVLDESEAVATWQTLAFSDEWQEYVDKGDALCGEFSKAQTKYVSGHALCALLNIDVEEYIDNVEDMLRKMGGRDAREAIDMLRQMGDQLTGTASFDLYAINDQGRPQFAAYVGTKSSDLIDKIMNDSGAAADSMAAAMSSNGQYLLPITEYDWFTEEENVVGVAAAGYSDGLTYYVTDSEKAMVEPDEHLKSSDIKGKGFFLRFDFSCLNDYEDMMGPEENKVLQKLASGLDCMEAYYEGSGKCVFRLSAKGSKSIAEVFGGIVKMFM